MSNEFKNNNLAISFIYYLQQKLNSNKYNKSIHEIIPSDIQVNVIGLLYYGANQLVLYKACFKNYLYYFDRDFIQNLDYIYKNNNEVITFLNKIKDKIKQIQDKTIEKMTNICLKN